MKKRKNRLNLFLAFFITGTVFFGGFLFLQIKEELLVSKQNEVLSSFVTEIEKPPVMIVEDDKEIVLEEVKFDKYDDLYYRNNDMVGWISLKDTSIDYPVMQTPWDQEYYLRKDFFGDYSLYGTPFVQADCNVKESDNIIVYGHMCSTDVMFTALKGYKNSDFRKEHPIIQFDLLDQPGEYEVFAVLVINVYTSSNPFKFYNYVDGNEEDYYDYVSQCKARSKYDIDVQPEYGQQLLTLVTCDWTTNYGRLLVVCRKVK